MMSPLALLPSVGDCLLQSTDMATPEVAQVGGAVVKG